MNELKQLRGSISDEEIEKAKSLNNVASEELLKWVNKLDGEINALSETVTNLEDKFKLEKAKEEIKQLKNSVVGIKINPVIEAWTTESMIKLVKEGNGVGYCQEDYIKCL